MQMKTYWTSGGKKTRVHAGGPPSRWFNPPPKPPKPTINAAVLADWNAYCRGESARWFRGHETHYQIARRAS